MTLARLSVYPAVLAAVVGVLLFFSGWQADAQQDSGQRASNEIKTIVGVRPWHVLKISDPQQIEVETTTATCAGLLAPEVSKVRKVEGRKAIRIILWVKREIAGECLTEARFVRKRIWLGAPLAHRAIYDGSTMPLKRRWPE